MSKGMDSKKNEKKKPAKTDEGEEGGQGRKEAECKVSKPF